MVEVPGDANPVPASMSDRIGIGVLTRLVPRELVEEIVVIDPAELNAIDLATAYHERWEI